jgi:predicted  nucleic acid-binding Zn-ribbon protein
VPDNKIRDVYQAEKRAHLYTKGQREKERGAYAAHIRHLEEQKVQAEKEADAAQDEAEGLRKERDQVVEEALRLRKENEDYARVIGLLQRELQSARQNPPDNARR